MSLTFHTLKTVAVFIAVLLVLGACFKEAENSNQEMVAPPASDYVVSLRANIPEFDQLAKEWHTDAYLLSVSLPIGYKDNKAYLYSVDYASPSDSLTLGITKMVDGNMMTDYYAHGVETPAYAIIDSDWKLDSLEIFDLGYRNFYSEYVSYEKEHICGHMGLGRNPNLPGNPVMWRVYFDICDSPMMTFLGNIIFNPLSGEVIEIHREPSLRSYFYNDEKLTVEFEE